jgi:two-component system chemotaxis sensor kinase CheA
MNLDQALQTFIAESRDLLQEMESSLLRLESAPDDTDTLNAIFRAAHTIKGSAGMFGLDLIVSFTHVVESALDKLRDGEISVNGEVVALLLKCGDHMNDLVTVIAVKNEKPDAKMIAVEDGLFTSLKALMGQAADTEAQSAVEAGIPVQYVARVEASGGGEVCNNCWHLSLRFGQNVLRNGMDPLSFIRYLQTLGEIASIVLLPDAMPSAEEMDPEACYLGFEIDFSSAADKATIAGVFDFVREDSAIHILPPNSRISEYIELINKLPEDERRLGEMLVASGALTQEELEEGLQIQRCPAKLKFETCAYTSDSGECGAEARPCIAQPTLDCTYTDTRPLGEILVEQQLVHKEVVDGALDKQRQTKERKTQENRYIRVHADKLDSLINLVGELVIAGASVNLLAARAGNPLLQESTSVISHLVEEIRDGALQLRMVQIGETFSRFQRVVRDVSQELGKDIELAISGAETELDKTVVEKIGDPLMHLVRNAMDHGIESAQMRAANGKPAKGTLYLNAYHDSGSIVIEVADDGGGLNRERILQKAVERGLVAANANLTAHEIDNLIFEPGFSTAEKLSNLSGRGVGMDVVRRNIESLRGTVELDNEPGKGTTVRIRLPLTLAIIDGFLVGVNHSSYVIPLDMVTECVELNASERQAARQRGYLNLRGAVLPLAWLRDQFEMVGEEVRRENVVVVHYGAHQAGLVVDELMGEFQTVIKPLGKMFSSIKGISGSTILGSGEVALILDVPSLIQHATERENVAVATEQNKRLTTTQQ